MNPTRKTRIFTALGAVSLLALAACGSQEPGSAAIVGGTSISEAAVESNVSSLLAAQGLTRDDANTDLTQLMLDRLITTELVEQAAAELDITADQGQLDAVIAAYADQVGGLEALKEYLIQQNVPPEELESILRVNLLAEKIGSEVDPSGTPETQSMALTQYITLYASDVGVTVNPRFGTWDVEQLSIASNFDYLSVPAAF